MQEDRTKPLAGLVAVLELSHRTLAQQPKERTIFATPDAVKHYLQRHLAAKPHEVFAVLLRDRQNKRACLVAFDLPQVFAISHFTDGGR